MCHCTGRESCEEYPPTIKQKGGGLYREIAQDIAELVIEKQKAYGNSFGEADQFLRLCYPDGVQVEKYKDMLYLERIGDKI